jgi:hypothetical protein
LSPKIGECVNLNIINLLGESGKNQAERRAGALDP